MKETKKLFVKRLRKLSQEYQDEVMAEATTHAEVNRNEFWKLVKRLKGGNKFGVTSIKDQNDKVVHEVYEIPGVWRIFDKLSCPKM